MTAETLLARFKEDDARAHLGAYLRRQRWFGGRGREATATDVVEAIPLREDEFAIWIVLVAVHYAQGEDDLYHVPLVRRHLAAATVTNSDDARLVVIGTENGEEVAIYDALADNSALQIMWQAIAGNEVHGGTAGELRLRNLRGIGVHIETETDAALRPLAREQTNSAVVRGDREMLKCLRRVVRGVSPEVEMTSALLSAGFDRVAAPLGTMEYMGDDGRPVLLALVQPYFRGGTEGWALALTSLRVHYADAEEAGNEQIERTEAATKGSTFTPEAVRIGALTAAMHVAMLDQNLPEGLRAYPVDRELLDRWAAQMTADLDRLLERSVPELDQLRAHREVIDAAFGAVRELADGGMAIRVHGDYHLGQLLRTDQGWIMLDFEGEPRRPLAERRAHSSPLNDVAGMLRSFDYAAAVELRERTPPGEVVSPTLERHGDEWVAVNRAAFWGAYTAAVAGSGLLPSGDGARTLLRAFELRKGVYEVIYELGHRPDWVSIPLRFLLGTGATAPVAS
jgi:maltokinase